MIHHLEGAGWFGDRWDDVKKVAKNVQKSSVVRDIEKGAVSAGSKALRGIAEVGLDGAADLAATAIGMPELSAPIDAAIDRGASALQKRGASYLDNKIDQSGKGIRYMSPSGGGLRLAGAGTQVANGLRLAGSGHQQQAQGLRLAGSGIMDFFDVQGHRKGTHGSGAPGPLVEGSGHACSCH